MFIRVIASTLLLSISTQIPLLSLARAQDLDGTREKLLQVELARIQKKEKELNDRLADLSKARVDIQDVKLQLEKARASRNKYIAIAIPSTVVLAAGLVLLGIHRTHLFGNRYSTMGRILAGVFGYPIAGIGGVSAAGSGVMIYIRQGDLNDFAERLTKLEQAVVANQNAARSNLRELAESKRNVCLIGEGRPADCEQKYEAELKKIEARQF